MENKRPFLNPCDNISIVLIKTNILRYRVEIYIDFRIFEIQNSKKKKKK